MPKIIVLSWHPGYTKIATAGGFKRLYEILKFSQYPVVIIDKYPSIYKDLSSKRITIYEYKSNFIQKFFDNNFPFFARILDRIFSFWHLLNITIRNKVCPQIIYVPFSELPQLSLAGVILKFIYHSRLVFCNLNVNTLPTDRFLNSLLHKFADKVITISFQLKKDLKNVGISAGVVNGVGFDQSNYFPSKVLRKEYDCIFIGRHTSEKGIFDLLEIWHELDLSYNLRPSLLTIGDIPDYLKSTILKIIDEYRLSDLITLAGNIDEKSKITNLWQSHICVFPSYQEGWGIVPMEALSAGLPVVAYDLPVYKESIGQGSGFVTVPIGNAREFAHIISDTLANYEKYAKLTKTWKPKVTWDQIAKKEWKIILS